MKEPKKHHRVNSFRASWWNYAWGGAYFVTICTHNRQHYFGEIKDGEMKLSGCGILADVFWHQIPHHAKNIELGSFVVMPNHIHGILIFKDETSLHNPTLPTWDVMPPECRFQNQGKNTLSAVIGSYKSAVSRHAKRLGFEFKWQNLFFDHIIRDDTDFDVIEKYITTNAENWNSDKFFK